jgi:HD-GYP domain-containing protein (c-di-GMP phosphodiesterase class II)
VTDPLRPTVNQPSIISTLRLPKPDRAVGRTGLQGPAGPSIGALLERAAAVDATFRLHSESVAALSCLVGRALGLGARALEQLELAAAVHDVGKLSVPPEILAKPGPLDDVEWRSMRDHPCAGAALLESCGAQTEVVSIVRSHHERWDGGGYPDGLAGDAIPIGARIIAVADAYCAMVESRPYRPPRPAAHARAELLAEAGKQFDVECAQTAYRIVAQPV